MYDVQQQLKADVSTLAHNMGFQIQTWTKDHNGVIVAILDDGSLFQPLKPNLLTNAKEQYQHVQAFFEHGSSLGYGF